MAVSFKGAHFPQDIILRLNMRSGELREQELEQGSQQGFPSSSHVVNVLKEAQIQRQMVL